MGELALKEINETAEMLGQVLLRCILSGDFSNPVVIFLEGIEGVYILIQDKVTDKATIKSKIREGLLSYVN